MGELRKDYILDRYALIVTDRAKRPDDFISEPHPVKEKICYFCPGNEHLTPPEIGRFPENADEWQIRVFPNKFPAVKQGGKVNLSTDNSFFTYSDAYGVHEVIVETPNHNQILADLTEERIVNYIKVIQKRTEVNLKNPNIKYVSVFKNKGKRAGTSIQHTHTQLIAYNIVPEAILKKELAVSKFSSCPYCSILNIEMTSRRACFDNEAFAAFTPYASRFPFEIWIFPKKHVLNINEFEDKEFVFLAEILKKILLKLKSLNAAYNFYLQYGVKNMHFHIEITPRLSTWAGFELSTGTVINTMSPEDAAEFYKKV